MAEVTLHYRKAVSGQTFMCSARLDDAHATTRFFDTTTGNEITDQMAFARHAVPLVRWVASCTKYELDLLNEGEMAFCTDDQTAWTRANGELVQLAPD